eukprot:768447-Hanusia_phi.AAC.1
MKGIICSTKPLATSRKITPESNPKRESSLNFLLKVYTTPPFSQWRIERKYEHRSGYWVIEFR